MVQALAFLIVTVVMGIIVGDCSSVVCPYLVIVLSTERRVKVKQCVRAKTDGCHSG